MKKSRLWIVAVLLLLASCGKMSLESIEIGKPYVGEYQGDAIVVVFDSVSEGAAEGHAYLDDGAVVVDPVDFSFSVGRKGRGRLQHGDAMERLKLSVGEASLRGTCGTSGFVLRPYVADSVSFRPFFEKPMYRVVEEQDKLYAHAVPGYWTSYPDTGESFGTIYMRKVPELAFTRDLDLYLDLYYPRETTPFARPLLVLIHGGAFYNGDKRSAGYPEMGAFFAKRGYVVASINYRMGFRPTGQSIDRAGYRAVQDAHAAVRYLICHAREYQIDPERIFVGGTSAGAITALNLAFMREDTRPEASRSITLGPDLGPLESVNPEMQLPFKVQAVVNMWGAVHDLSMLNSSRETDVLSFHGDMDPIVPYDYGCPFKDMVSSVVEDVFRPMYGSKSIHDKVISMGGRSELHTCHGGGHSLHADGRGGTTAYFNDTILPNMNRFLCEELVGGEMVRLVQTEPDGQWFEALGDDHVSEMHWWIDGGAIVDRQGNDKVKVLFFGDASDHAVKVSGKYRNGMEFCELLQK